MRLKLLLLLIDELYLPVTHHNLTFAPVYGQIWRSFPNKTQSAGSFSK